jgi:hypothetical protein
MPKHLAQQRFPTSEYNTFLLFLLRLEEISMLGLKEEQH